MRSKATILIALVVLMFVLVAVPCYAKELSKAYCIGHRGAMDQAPENTKASFQRAFELGYKAFECDVWYNNSRELMVCHPYNTYSQTGKNINIWKITSRNRRRYPVRFGKKVYAYSKQYYMTLDEVLRFASTHDMGVYLHLKARGGHSFTKTAIKKLYKIIVRHGCLNKAVAFSSNKRIVQLMKKYPLRKGILTNKYNYRQLLGTINIGKAYGCKIIIHPYKKNKSPSKRMIAYAHKKGLKVICYRIKNKRSAVDAINRGEDFIIVNRYLFNDGI